MSRTTAGLPPLLALALAAAGGLTAVGVSSAPATAAVPRDGLVAEYLLDESAGTVVRNSADGSLTAGDPRDAVLRQGSDSLWRGGALRLSGGATSSGPWVELPDDLLAGEQQATITTEVKAAASALAGFHFLWNIGGESTQQYLFSSLNCASDRRPLVGLKDGTEQLVQASSCAVSADRWASVTAVVDGAADTASLWVDGVRVASGPTTLSPADITDQSLNTLGRAPWPDPLFRGEIGAFRVWDRALSGEEVAAVAAEDAAGSAEALVAGLSERTVDGDVTLPTRGGQVAWTSADPALVTSTGEVTQPPIGAPARSTVLTATAAVRGRTATKQLTYTVEPTAAPDDDYGYAMVHFIEDSRGYAEKIYLDVSRGDDPTHWRPLNDGRPILASNLGTTGVRDPYLTRNPRTGTWYVIATDLRVFGGADPAGSWGKWSSRGSLDLVVWESDDLVEWGEPRRLPVAPPEAGMAWAPEATWDEATGQFVVYWASTLWSSADPARAGGSYSRIVYGTTTDFTPATFTYRGAMIDRPGSDIIDTTVLQHEGTTYRLSKDNGGTRKGVFMEKTTAPRWYEPGASWTEVQTNIGRADWGSVEGPALFKDHDRDHWYLYVDVIPSIGYRPYETGDLAQGWTRLDTEQTGFSMTPSTKHGGIVSLTKADHDRLVEADVDELLTQEVALGTVEGQAPALPATASVRLRDASTASVPVTWESVDPATWSTPGTVQVRGTVAAIGNNLNQTAYPAGQPLSSATAIDNVITATVTVASSAVTPPVTPPAVAPPAAAPAPSSLSTRVRPSRVAPGERPRLRLRLSGVTATGPVVVTLHRGAKVRWTATVPAGGTSIRLPRQARAGRYVVRVSWAGSATSAPATATTTYRVRR